ncbi:MAG TPA: AGE family epimerase/isomerase, partial [bacterium]|nr:AGE family epimerase/isomerase [bacterium]
VVSNDVYLWSQLRAIWTFSALFNRIEPRQEWLDIARDLFDFCRRHGRDSEGRWCYRLSPQGEILDGPISIYADGFAIYGLCEYYKATQDERAWEIAFQTFRNVQKRLAVPGSYQTAPYIIPQGAKAHAVAMIFSYFFHEMGKVFDSPEILQAGLTHAREVMDHFLRPESGLVLEYVTLDGKTLPGAEGRIVVPGHAIESMWFQMQIFRDHDEDDMIRKAVNAVQKHLEFGWDAEHGGLFLGGDSEGQAPVWPNWNKKIWWPHTEALYALIRAREYSHEPWIDEWFSRIFDYCFTHFYDRKHGEWTQRLDRFGNKITEVVALPVKDPFHLPRALILSIESLERQMH